MGLFKSLHRKKWVYFFWVFVFMLAAFCDLFAESGLPPHWKIYIFSKYHFSLASPISPVRTNLAEKQVFRLETSGQEKTENGFKLFVLVESKSILFGKRKVKVKDMPDLMLRNFIDEKALKHWKFETHEYHLNPGVPSLLTTATGLDAQGIKTEIKMLAILYSDDDCYGVVIRYPYGEKEKEDMATRIITSFELL
jgi:hypothetical protein